MQILSVMLFSVFFHDIKAHMTVRTVITIRTAVSDATTMLRKEDSKRKNRKIFLHCVVDFVVVCYKKQIIYLPSNS